MSFRSVWLRGSISQMPPGFLRSFSTATLRTLSAVSSLSVLPLRPSAASLTPPGRTAGQPMSPGWGWKNVKRWAVGMAGSLNTFAAARVPILHWHFRPLSIRIIRESYGLTKRRVNLWIVSEQGLGYCPHFTPCSEGFYRSSNSTSYCWYSFLIAFFVPANIGSGRFSMSYQSQPSHFSGSISFGSPFHRV
jgi:hypothetical protein